MMYVQSRVLLCLIVITALVQSQSTVDIVENPHLPFHSLLIYGNMSLGYYYVNLYIGTPKQQQSMIIDTGSNTTTVPCKKCKECGQHINPFFNSASSQTSKFITCDMTPMYPALCQKNCQGKLNSQDSCGFAMVYTEGSSLHGVYLEDYVQLEDNSTGEAVKMAFGCTTQESYIFNKQKANGVLGLAPQRIYSLQKFFTKHHSVTQELLSVSICLSRNGGVLSVGGTNDSYHNRSPVITKFSTQGQKKFYKLQGVSHGRIGDIVFHNPNMNLGKNGIFIDSGSTITFMPFNQYILLRTEIDKLCLLHLQCQMTEGTMKRIYHLLDDQQSRQLTVNETQIEVLQRILIKVFPPITLEINGQQVQWKASQYFSIYSLADRDVILGVDGLGDFILGSNWMVNKDIFFNLKAKTVQIYQDSNCNLLDDQKPIVAEYHKGVSKHKLTYIKKQLTTINP